VRTVSPGAPSLLRRHNAALVLSVLLADSPLTRAEIARRAHLSKPTINKVVDDLIEAGFVLEREHPDAIRPVRVGRRGRPVAIRGDGGYLVGVDIGAQKVQTLVTDLTGTVLASDRRATASDSRPKAKPLLAAVRRSIDAALKCAAVDIASVRAMGLGMPGDIDPATGKVILAPQIEGFEGLKLKELVESWFPCPVSVDNEVHLAVLGERWRGVARGVDDAVLINVGIGIAAGILIGGALHRGSTGAAGEIGYLPLVEQWLQARPPHGWGALEYSAGGLAYARLAKEVLASREATILREFAGDDAEAPDAKAVFEAARRGDAAARRIVDELLDLLARAVASVVVVLDPSLVVIAGGIARAGADLLDPLSARVRALVPMHPRIALTALADDAVSTGAIYVAHEAAWAKLQVSPFDEMSA
jgi:predicted NBD/HSP70 family sugar kinase